MPEIRPKDRSNDTTPFSLSSTNVYEPAHVEPGLAARIESSGKRESSGGRMQESAAVGETLIPKSTSEGVVLTVLSQLNNGKIKEALASFAEEFQFKDHGIGLEFKNKERLAEFFYKTRELYPDCFL